MQLIIQNINWKSKCVIFMGICLDVLDNVEFPSFSVSIQIQLKEIQSINVHLNSKRPKSLCKQIQASSIEHEK